MSDNLKRKKGGIGAQGNSPDESDSLLQVMIIISFDNAIELEYIVVLEQSIGKLVY